VASVLCVSYLNKIFIFTIIGIRMVYGQDGSGSISGMARFFLLYIVQTGPGAHTGGSFPGVTAAGA
jgi:hypothetical protein